MLLFILFGCFWWAVRLIAGMSCTECRMVFQFPVDPEDDWERSEVDVESPRVEDLRYEAAVRYGDLIADAVLPGARRQKLLDGPETAVYPVLGPLVLLLLADVDQHDEVLKRLDAGCYHFANFSCLCTFDEIVWHKIPLRSGLLQVMQDAQRFHQSVSINV